MLFIEQIINPAMASLEDDPPPSYEEATGHVAVHQEVKEDSPASLIDRLNKFKFKQVPGAKKPDKRKDRVLEKHLQAIAWLLSEYLKDGYPTVIDSVLCEAIYEKIESEGRGEGVGKFTTITEINYIAKTCSAFKWSRPKDGCYKYITLLT